MYRDTLAGPLSEGRWEKIETRHAKRRGVLAFSIRDEIVSRFAIASDRGTRLPRVDKRGADFSDPYPLVGREGNIDPSFIHTSERQRDRAVLAGRSKLRLCDPPYRENLDGRPRDNRERARGVVESSRTCASTYACKRKVESLRVAGAQKWL